MSNSFMWDMYEIPPPQAGVNCFSSPPVNTMSIDLRDLRVREKLCNGDIHAMLWPRICVRLFDVFPKARAAMYSRFGELYIQKIKDELQEPVFVHAFVEELIRQEVTWAKLCVAVEQVGCGQWLYLVEQLIMTEYSDITAGYYHKSRPQIPQAVVLSTTTTDCSAVLTTTPVGPPAPYKLPTLTI